MIHLIINAIDVADNYIESIIIAWDRVVSQFMLHILFTFGHIVTISCACERMIWYCDCDLGVCVCFFLLLFSHLLSKYLAYSVHSQSDFCFVSKRYSLFPFCFFFFISIFIVWCTCFVYRMIFAAWMKIRLLPYFDCLWMCRKREKKNEISFIFADPINLSTEWMKSNGIHLETFIELFPMRCCNDGFLRHLQDNQNVSTL